MKMITKSIQTKDKSNYSDTTPSNVHICKLAIFSYHIHYILTILPVYIFVKPCKFYSLLLFSETSVIYFLQMTIEFNTCISHKKIIGISLYIKLFWNHSRGNCILIFQNIQDKYRLQYIHTKYVKHFVFSVLC